MARVLVTGATGFIGQHLIKYFANSEYEVSALVRKKSDCSAIQDLLPKICVGDLNDLRSLRQAIGGCDLVVNAAGITKSLNRQRMFHVNESGAANVARACADQFTPPTLVHISSLAASGPSFIDRLRDESDIESPVSNYGRSKLAGEKVLRRFAGDVPISIIRPPIVFGSRDRDFYQVFKSIARYGFVFVPPFGHLPFSVIHATDLAQAVHLTAKSGERLSNSSAVGVYYAAAKTRHSFEELARSIGLVLNQDSVRMVKTSRAFVWLLGGFTEAASKLIRKPFIMNLDKAREATAGPWGCRTDKIEGLNFQPEPLLSRLQQTADWYVKNGWLPNPITRPPGELEMKLNSRSQPHF